MKIVGIFVLGSFLLGNLLLTSVAHSSDMLNFLTLNFKTQALQDCASDIPCALVEPKEWTQEEAEFLNATINKFKYGGLRDILFKIRSIGYFSFERTSYWFYRDMSPSTGFKPSKNESIHGITRNYDYYTIIFTDAFFNDALVTDPISNANRKEITLLHEISHALDYKGLFSKDPEFLQLAGFDYDDNGVTFVSTKATPKELYDINIVVDDMRTEKKSIEAEQSSRQFGMERGLPRVYSFSNSAEAFADIVSFIYFDPTASTYLDAKLIEYIDTNVLKGARSTF